MPINQIEGDNQANMIRLLLERLRRTRGTGEQRAFPEGTSSGQPERPSFSDSFSAVNEGIGERQFRNPEEAGPTFFETFEQNYGVSPELGRKSRQLEPTIDVESFAQGGLIRKPTVAILGEEGPEVVVPLKRPSSSTFGPDTSPGGTAGRERGVAVGETQAQTAPPASDSPLTRESALDTEQTPVYEESMSQILELLQNIQVSPQQQELTDLQIGTARGVDPNVAEERFRENELPRMQRILEDEVLPGIRAEQIASGNFWSSGRADAVGDATEKFGEYASGALNQAIREGRESGQRAMPGAMDAAALPQRLQMEALQQAFPWLQLPTELSFFEQDIPDITIGGTGSRSAGSNATIGTGDRQTNPTGSHLNQGFVPPIEDVDVAGQVDENFEIRRPHYVHLLEELRRKQLLESFAKNEKKTGTLIGVGR